MHAALPLSQQQAMGGTNSKEAFRTAVVDLASHQVNGKNGVLQGMQVKRCRVVVGIK